MRSGPQYHTYLYMSPGITVLKLDKLKKKLEKHPERCNVYLLTTARNGYDQMEIYHTNTLIWPYYRKNPPYIIGIADSYEEALTLLEQITTECFKARGDLALREYLSC